MAFLAVLYMYWILPLLSCKQIEFRFVEGIPNQNGDNFCVWPEFVEEEPVGSMGIRPCARVHAGMAKLDANSVYLFGGVGKYNPYDFSAFFYNDVWRYDIKDNKWEYLSGSREEYTEGMSPVFADRAEFSNVTTPQGLFFHSMGAVDTRTFFVHGGISMLNSEMSYFHDGAIYSDLYLYDVKLRQWKWEYGDGENGVSVNWQSSSGGGRATPGGRIGHQAFYVKQLNLIVEFGGGGIDKDDYLKRLLFYNDVFAYNFAHQRWQWIGGEDTINPGPVYPENASEEGIITTELQPSGRYGMAGWVHNRRELCILGGYGLGFNEEEEENEMLEFGGLNDVWCFHITKTMWRYLTGSKFVNVQGSFSSSNTIADDFHPSNVFPNKFCANAVKLDTLGDTIAITGGIVTNNRMSYYNSNDLGFISMNEDTTHRTSDIALFRLSSREFAFAYGNFEESVSSISEGVRFVSFVKNAEKRGMNKYDSFNQMGSVVFQSCVQGEDLGEVFCWGGSSLAFMDDVDAIKSDPFLYVIVNTPMKHTTDPFTISEHNRADLWSFRFGRSSVASSVAYSITMLIITFFILFLLLAFFVTCVVWGVIAGKRDREEYEYSEDVFAQHRARPQPVNLKVTDVSTINLDSPAVKKQHLHIFAGTQEYFLERPEEVDSSLARVPFVIDSHYFEDDYLFQHRWAGHDGDFHTKAHKQVRFFFVASAILSISQFLLFLFGLVMTAVAIVSKACNPGVPIDVFVLILSLSGFFGDLSSSINGVLDVIISSKDFRFDATRADLAIFKWLRERSDSFMQIWADWSDYLETFFNFMILEILMSIGVFGDGESVTGEIVCLSISLFIMFFSIDNELFGLLAHFRKWGLLRYSFLDWFSAEDCSESYQENFLNTVFTQRLRKILDVAFAVSFCVFSLVNIVISPWLIWFNSDSWVILIILYSLIVVIAPVCPMLESEDDDSNRVSPSEDEDEEEITEGYVDVRSQLYFEIRKLVLLFLLAVQSLLQLTGVGWPVAVFYPFFHIPAFVTLLFFDVCCTELRLFGTKRILVYFLDNLWFCCCNPCFTKKEEMTTISDESREGDDEHGVTMNPFVIGCGLLFGVYRKTKVIAAHQCHKDSIEGKNISLHSKVVVEQVVQQLRH